VATKLDKVRPSRLAGRKQQVAKACGVAERDVLWVSAAKGTGIDRLRDVIVDLLTDR
jgi:selenocysteine-specific translation elongation factor